MRRALPALLVAGALTVGVPTAAAQARRIPIDEGGDTAPCVVYDEYLVIQDAFMQHRITRSQVRRVFDTDGHRTSTAVIDTMTSQVDVAPGYEAAVPRRRMVRKYPVCVDARTPNGGYTYVEFNLRHDQMVASVLG